MVKHPELLAVAVTAQLAKMVKAAGDRARLDAADVLDNGDSVTLRSPDGVKLGKAVCTDPNPVAVVSDKDALTAWLHETYPDQVETTEEVSGDTSAVLEVLREHAPHLVVRTSRLAKGAIPDVLAASAEAGAPVGPGGEVDVPGVRVETPRGVLGIRLDTKTAPAAIAAMWAAGHVVLDGAALRLVLPTELPTKPGASA